MAELKIRNIDFQFDPETPYYWNPGNPYFGNFVNYITCIAPAFERYFIRTMREAIPQIKNPEVVKEADLFCMQEGQHSKHHMNHLNILIAQHPGLQTLKDQIEQSYEDLFKNESLAFNLAYAAVIELGFGPTARFVVNNRDKLFMETDNKIASFILWHMVEEFEHRNAAIDVYNDIVGSYWFRIKAIPKIVRHLMEIEEITRTELDKHVAPFDFEGTQVLASDPQDFMRGVSVKNRSVFFYEIFCSLLPFHKPDNLHQPDWVTQWFKDEDAGMDMRTYYASHS